MKLKDELMIKYDAYKSAGHAVFAATLSTFLTSAAYAKSDKMRLWDIHFIHRVKEQLPYRAKSKLDHDYVIERSPDGFLHYHGLLAVPHEYEDRIWRNGALHRPIDRALQTFREKGKYRPCCVNKYLIEPMRSVTAWATYITKTDEYISSAAYGDR